MKTKTQTHTPGPWHVEPKVEDHGASLVICDTVEGILAVIPPLNEDDDPTAETAKRGPHDLANAALMAAGPDFLALLEKIDTDIAKHLAPGSLSTFMTLVNAMSAQSKLIRAAIAKAKAARP